MMGYELEMQRLANGSFLIDLQGEFDLYSLNELQCCIGVALSSGLPTFIELSGVTLADVAIMRGLAAYNQFYSHHLTLCNPSWQLLRANEAAGLSGWLEFA